MGMWIVMWRGVVVLDKRFRWKFTVLLLDVDLMGLRVEVLSKDVLLIRSVRCVEFALG